MKAYLICMYPHSNGLDVVGPFATDEAAKQAGIKWQEENNDSPCWQTTSNHTFDFSINFVSPS